MVALYPEINIRSLTAMDLWLIGTDSKSLRVVYPWNSSLQTALFPSLQGTSPTAIMNRDSPQGLVMIAVTADLLSLVSLELITPQIMLPAKFLLLHLAAWETAPGEVGRGNMDTG